MNRILRLTVAALLVTAGATALFPASAQTVIRVSPDSAALPPGSPVMLAFMVDNVSGLHLYHVVAHFDNTILRCDSIASGGFLPGTFFFHAPPVFPSDTARYVTVDDALAGIQTRSGSGTFFMLWFTALQAGSTPVMLVETVLRDGSNQNIAHSVQQGMVTVEGMSMNVTVPVNANWNLISVPLVVPDYRKTSVFPSSISQAFRFAGGYLPTDTLENGQGYWLKFPAADELLLSGYARPLDTIDVNGGWNIVGGLSFPVDTGSVAAVPPLTITSDFFGYASPGGYTPADTLIPGRGYWVKVDRPGRIALHADAPGWR